jgi:hypothetical protein
MALVPLDSSNQLSLYGNNKFGSTSNPLVQSFSPKTECPIDPRNDLLPPGYTSPLIDMKFGPPEQTIKRYFSLTVNDIETFHKEKIKKWIKVYEKVLGNCYRKIREHAMRDQKYCFFPVPEYIAGFPLFNITHCVCFIIKKLNQAGFQTKFIPSNIIYIHWDVENQYERVTNHQDKLPKPPSQQTRQIQNKDIHYVKIEQEKENINDNGFSESVVPFQQPQITNNSKYAYQQVDQFLFG